VPNTTRSQSSADYHDHHYYHHHHGFIMCIIFLKRTSTCHRHPLLLILHKYKTTGITRNNQLQPPFSPSFPCSLLMVVSCTVNPRLYRILCILYFVFFIVFVIWLSADLVVLVCVFSNSAIGLQICDNKVEFELRYGTSRFRLCNIKSIQPAVPYGSALEDLLRT